MAAIVRIKRRADEEPLNGIVINCKRPKTNCESDTKENTLLQFVTTLEEPTEDVLTHIKRNTKDDLEREYKKHFNNISLKIKEQRESALKNSRFKLINTFRSKGLLPDDPEDNSEINYTLLEVDGTEEKDNIQSSDSPAVKYVYDLYYTNSDDFADDTIDYQDIDIHPLNFDLVNEPYRGNAFNDMNDDDSDDSEDSNAENNWRNDYPDEMDGDADSITEQDMLNAMQRITVEDELSNDDGEEGFVYSIDSEAAGFEEDIDDSDVQRYGERYARFKALHKRTDSSDDGSDPANHDLLDATLGEDDHYY